MLLLLHPPTAIIDAVNSMAGHSKHPTQRRAAHVDFVMSANETHSLPRQHCMSIFVARCIAVAVTTFVHLIAGIVGRSPKPKMVRIDASAIVARMTNVHPFWYWTKMQFIRIAVRPHGAPSVQGIGKHSVTTTFKRRPVPAFSIATSIYFRPKSLVTWLKCTHKKSPPLEYGCLFRTYHAQRRTSKEAYRKTPNAQNRRVWYVLNNGNYSTGSPVGGI